MECLAVTAHVSPGAATSGSLIGQPYRALVRFDRGRFTWCQIVQMPGELSIARESVLEVPTACGGRR
jgi:hypothetical protein